MRWSLHLGSFRGIAVYVHATFFLLLAFWAYTGWTAMGTAAAALVSVLFIVAVFGCVLLHEFGHALMAARFGIPTRDIVLYPIGGVARLERMPREPARELWVALAGPAVNVAIAAVLFLWLELSGALVPLSRMGSVHGPFLERLMLVNVGLVLFNLVPAFPMDGGRVMRALLALRLPYVQATTIAARTGQLLALLFAAAGLFTSSPMLVLIAVFVWMAAGAELRHVQVQSALGGVPLQHVMQTDVRVVEASTPIIAVVRGTVAGGQRDFPVVSGGQLLGVLWYEDLLRALQEGDQDAPVGPYVDRGVAPAHLGERVEAVLQRLSVEGSRLLPVTNALGRLVGIVTPETMGVFLRMQAALRR
ncbi:MAG: site-2 protease family protein [Candidatus Krumholzibacteriia bacterium]